MRGMEIGDWWTGDWWTGDWIGEWLGRRYSCGMRDAAVMQGSWSRQREAVLLAGILLLAAALRMGWPGLTEFKGDEARLLRLSLQMARLEAFPLRGISSSVGLPNFPASVWLYTLPLVLWRHVLAATLYTGLLNVLAVLGTWWLTRRMWGPRAALAAALLFAVCPWAVAHSRKIWAQNLLAPLVVGWGISAILGFVDRRAWMVTVHLLLLALAAQVHPAGAALVPASAFFLVFFRRRLQPRAVLAGLGVALLTAAPFLVYLARAEGATRRFVDLLLIGRGDVGGLSLTPWRYVLLLSTGSEIHSLAGPEQYRAYLERLPPMTLVYALWLALMAGGALWLLQRLRHRRRGDEKADAALILVVWLLAPPLFFTFFPSDTALHYLLPVYPVPFVLAGLGYRLVEQRTAPFMSLALVISAALQVWAWAHLLAFVAAQATPGGFGTPLAHHLQAVDEAQRLLQETGAQEALIAGRGEDPGESEFAAVYDVLLSATPHRFVNATRSAVFPTAPAVVLLDTGLSGEAAAQYRAAAAARRDVALREGEGALQIVALPAQAAPEPPIRLPEPAILANYVKLLGFGVAQDDGALTWLVTWQTADSPVPADYHFFNHLLDGDGQRVAQADAAAFDPAQWRQGDVVVSAFTLETPPQAPLPWTMRVGMYAFGSGENVPVIDVAGNAAADAVEVAIGD